MIRIALAFAVASPALAEDWRPPTEATVASAPTSRSFVYEGGATQEFHADGRTLHEVQGSPSRGSRRVDGDRYCSRWPPREGWDCYAVEAKAAGLDLRFTGASEAMIAGRYQDLR